jgi:hypothetical protein
LAGLFTEAKTLAAMVSNQQSTRAGLTLEQLAEGSFVVWQGYLTRTGEGRDTQCTIGWQQCGPQSGQKGSNVAANDKATGIKAEPTVVCHLIQMENGKFVWRSIDPPKPAFDSPELDSVDDALAFAKCRGWTMQKHRESEANS